MTGGKWSNGFYKKGRCGMIGLDDDPADISSDNVACKRCGEDGLTWLHTGLRWRLIGENARFHERTKADTKVSDDFEALD